MSDRLQGPILPLHISVVLVMLLALPALAIDPQRIDALIAARSPQPPAPPASDAEFLRRAYLDLTGCIPAPEVSRQFLADTDAEKRVKLIDRLLATPEYARRMQEAFDVMLMERRTGGGEPAEAWAEYLRSSFAANKPWDQLAREVLSPNADDPATRASALFLAKRLEANGQVPIDYPGLAADVGRMFLGVDLKCAQCHDHLSVKDHKQEDFQGLFAFVSQIYIRTDAPAPAVGERPLAMKIEYASVFKPDEKKQTGPRVPGGAEVEVPAYAQGEEFAQPPDPSKSFPGVLKFSPLKALGEQLPRAESEAFRRNIANRLWFLMMGRGLVQPLDLYHSENPPSHPELLDYLGSALAEAKFDTRVFVRALALTQAYQRSSLLPEGQPEPAAESYAVAIGKRMSAEQLMWSLLTATGELEVIRFAPADSKDPAAPGLAEVRKRFLSAFAAPAGEQEVDFAPTVAAALFLSNDKLILERLTPRPNNLIDRLAKLADAAAVADEFYLSVLTRMPSEEEKADVAAYLEQHAQRRTAALSELAWSLLTSTEFCVNH